MLIGIVSAISAAVAALTGWLAGAYTQPVRLWVLPVSFVGCFLLIAGLWYLMILIMTRAVDMDKVQEKDNSFYRLVATWTVGALVTVLRVRIRTKGMEKAPRSGRFLLVCNHLHDTDPIVLLHTFRKSQLAFVSKKENDSMKIIGPFMRKLLCQPINRENDREALKTILRCIQLLKEDKVSMGVFPEGYCYPDKLLHPFRSGVFKIAQKAQVPIVVCTVRNTHYIYPNMRKLKPSRVELHLVDVIPAEALQGRTAVDVAEQVYALMAEDLGPALVLPREDVK